MAFQTVFILFFLLLPIISVSPLCAKLLPLQNLRDVNENGWRDTMWGLIRLCSQTTEKWVHFTTDALKGSISEEELEDEG